MNDVLISELDVYVRFLRYDLLNSGKEMEENMSIDEDSTNRNVPKNPPLLCLQPDSPLQNYTEYTVASL